MTAFQLARRTLLLAPLFLAACGEEPPESYPPLSYGYLTTLKLDVGRIDIDDSWAPRGAARHVEYLAPVRPRDALRQMAEDRLVAGGNSGRAVFVIEDASIIRGPRNYEGSLAVRLDIADASGARVGEAVARVVQVRPIGGDAPQDVREELYAFVRDMMKEMNVEFEYQVRRAMRDTLQTTSPSAPAPGPVETQSLDNPGGAPAGAAPTAPTMSPPPQPLRRPVPPSR